MLVLSSLRKYLKFGQKLFDKVHDIILMSDFYRQHITLKFNKHKLSITAIDHVDLVTAKYYRINKYRLAHSFPQFVNFALRQAVNGCNHIIFLIDQEDGRFVQFWTRPRFIYLDFPMWSGNKLKAYHSQVLTLLKSYGFTKTKNCLAPPSRSKNKSGFFYSYNTCEDGLSLNANFQTNYAVVTDFTIKLLNGAMDIHPSLVDYLLG